jgi:hypothetical protein
VEEAVNKKDEEKGGHFSNIFVQVGIVHIDTIINSGSL